MRDNFSVSDAFTVCLGIENDTSRGMQCIVGEWE